MTKRILTLGTVLILLVGMIFLLQKDTKSAEQVLLSHTGHNHGNSGYCKVPAHPGLASLPQPDGSEIQAYIKGNQAVHYLRTTDGYTLLRDSDGYYKYAISSEKGNLVPSTIIASPIANRSQEEKNFLAGTKKELGYTSTTLSKKKEAYNNRLAAAAQEPHSVFPSTGTRKALMLLIDYPDQPFTFSNAAIDNMMNQTAYSVNGASGSFREYYMETSYGDLVINTDVLGWYTAANNRAFYANSPSPTDLVREAVDAAESAGTDFSQYDGDGDGEVDVVMVIHSGRGEEESGDADDIWSHRWALSAGGNSVTYDGKLINDYIIQPEKYGATNITNIGVVVHEFGHALGLPDLYDTNGATDGEGNGAGDWCVMAAGTWNNSGKTPAHMSAWCKEQMGWGTLSTLSSATSITGMDYWENAGEYYKIPLTGVNEYFLISNRQKLGWDAYIPGEGLDIWHISPSAITGNVVNSNTSHYGVQLEQADNLNDLNNNTDNGDTGDLFPGSTNNATFDCNSSPSSATHLGANSEVRVYNIAESGTSMSFDYSTCTPVFLDCSSATSMSCNNTYNGTTIGAVNNVSTYSCSANNMSGNEVVYELVLAQSTDITITLSGTTGDLDLFLLNSCAETSCLATGDNSLNYLAGAGTYFLVVDGKNGANSAFTLNTSCYCGSQGLSVVDEWIETVTIAGITNTSGSNGGYQDFTGTTIPMDQNGSYNLSLTPGHSGTLYNEYWKVWIDYNKNGSFDDAGELVFDAGSATNAVVTGSFQVPCDAPLGNTRMRVSMRYNVAQTSCEAFDYGEVEDYTVNIQAFSAPTTVMAQSSNTTYTANSSCTDATGWTHYFYNDGSTDYILLSLYPNAGETQLNVVPANVTITTGSTNTESLTSSGSASDYITNPNGWYVMNRYWNVTPTAQPLLPVKVRTYFTNTEYSEVQTLANSNGASATAMTDLVFYKATGSSPSDHYNIPEASITLYNNGDPSTGNFWELGTHGSNNYAELFVNSFSGGGGGIGGGTGSGPLPVELVTFTGKRDKDDVILNWETASEHNSDYYEIQRSLDRNEFITLGKEESLNSASGFSYSFLDSSPQNGDNYYRLKMVDKDGSYEYSNVINIVFGSSNFISMFPNPHYGKGDIFIKYHSQLSSPLDISIYTKDGMEIFSRQFDLSNGENNLSLAFPQNAASGVYIIRLSQGGEEYYHRFFHDE